MAIARETTGVGELDSALASIVGRAAENAGADVVVARLLDDSAGLTARAVHAASAALRAELEGSRLGPGAVPLEPRDELLQLPRPLRRVAEQLGATVVLQLPVLDGREVVGSLELLRQGGDFDERERRLALAAAEEIALARRALGDGDGSTIAPDLLGLAGDALTAGSDETRAAEQVATLAAEATGARACLVWRYEPQGPVLAALSGTALETGAALEAVGRARDEPVSLALEEVEAGGALVTLQLGEPPQGALQLLLAEEVGAGDPLLERLGTFAVRAAHALRAGERRQTLSLELERTRALLTIVGQAIAQLSLTHTLDTAIEHVSGLLGAERLAVYLTEEAEPRLEAGCGARADRPARPRRRAPARAPARPRPWPRAPLHSLRGERPAPGRRAGRARGGRDRGRDRGAAAGARRPDRPAGRVPGRRARAERERRVARARARGPARGGRAERAPARAHEARGRRATAGARRRARDLAPPARAVRDLPHLLREPLARPDAGGGDAHDRRDARGRRGFAADARRARHGAGAGRDDRAGRAAEGVDAGDPLVAATALAGAAERLPQRAADRSRRAHDQAARQAHEPLLPFLEKGSSAAVIPLATQAEMLGTLTLVSLDPERPIAGETLEAATSIAGQAALALDNARLYQQQKQFADSMQRSLLPRSQPQAAGLDVGAVYASSAHMEVGGDVYDFLRLADGRLAVVLGDVTGHGIDAAADMAMAKFVFRSLAREHPDPGDFLAAANEVVVEEIGEGKFITMLYLTADGSDGELACASAGHPPPRIVRAGASPAPLGVRGLALGIADQQEYGVESVHLEPGDAAVLYTDGLLEARRDGELYGEERLDVALAANASLSAEELAQALVEDCRAFAGDLADDCAVVVVKRT